MLVARRPLARPSARAPRAAACRAPQRPARAYGTRHAVTTWSAEEEQLRNSVARFAREVIAPKVKEMDEKSELDREVLRACFEQGLMGVEVPTELGGAGMSFTSAIITVEELAKVDPAVSVGTLAVPCIFVCVESDRRARGTAVDVQNTLVNTIIRKWGSKEQQQKYLPRLSADTVGSFCLSEWGSGSDAFALKTRAVRSPVRGTVN